MKSILEKPIKSKNFKDGKILITNPSPNLILLLFLDKNNFVKKTKSFFCSEKIKKTMIKLAKQEFRLWVNIKYKIGYLTEDDYDLYVYKNIDRNFFI